MDYRIDKGEDNRLVATFAGRLTFVDANGFHEVADAIRQSASSVWVFDFKELEFIDSAGLGMLLMVRDVISGLGNKLTIRHAQGQVRKALDLARFQELLLIED